MKASKKTQAKTGKQANGPLHVTNQVVAFLDLLGYRRLLDQHNHCVIPDDRSGQKQVMEGLIDAIHVRRRMMGQAQVLIDSIVAPVPETNGLPKQVREDFLATRHVHIYKSEGPDHVILGSSCAFTPEAHYPPRGTFALLTNASVLALMQLYMGGHSGLSLPLRGGIALGPGIEAQPENFLYSPALTTAYDIESQKASVPRIVVQEKVVEYIEDMVAGADKTPKGVLIDTMARQVRGMIVNDNDGLYILDFYGPAAAQLMDGRFTAEMSAHARQFVRDSLADARLRNATRLIEKYQYLHEYMEDRAKHWPQLVQVPAA